MSEQTGAAQYGGDQQFGKMAAEEEEILDEAQAEGADVSGLDDAKPRPGGKAEPKS
jgi:hypothetical protein